MIINLCHACYRVNPAVAQRCEACSAALDAAVTQPRPLPALDEPASSGAIWFDDLEEPCPKAQTGIAPAAAAVPEALPQLAITLRECETVAPAGAQWPVGSARPATEAPVLFDNELRPLAACAPAIAPVTPQPVLPRTVRAMRKAERRAAVRKSRLRDKPAAGAASTVAEVLVFDAHDGERERLRKLLLGLGFCVHAVGRADAAAWLAASHTFVAAFVDIALDAADGGAGIDLCQRLRAASQCRGDAATLLVLVSTRLQPMDRVRAELAGCEESLLKPVTRGSVAGVLDSRGIALPTDPRQV